VLYDLLVLDWVTEASQQKLRAGLELVLDRYERRRGHRCYEDIGVK
jgi:hypothetical protein